MRVFALGCLFVCAAAPAAAAAVAETSDYQVQAATYSAAPVFSPELAETAAKTQALHDLLAATAEPPAPRMLEQWARAYYDLKTLRGRLGAEDGALYDEAMGERLREIVLHLARLGKELEGERGPAGGKKKAGADGEAPPAASEKSSESRLSASASAALFDNARTRAGASVRKAATGPGASMFASRAASLNSPGAVARSTLGGHRRALADFEKDRLQAAAEPFDFSRLAKFNERLNALIASAPDARRADEARAMRHRILLRAEYRTDFASRERIQYDDEVWNNFIADLAERPLSTGAPAWIDEARRGPDAGRRRLAEALEMARSLLNESDSAAAMELLARRGRLWRQAGTAERWLADVRRWADARPLWAQLRRLQQRRLDLVARAPQDFARDHAEITAALREFGTQYGPMLNALSMFSESARRYADLRSEELALDPDGTPVVPRALGLADVYFEDAPSEGDWMAVKKTVSGNVGLAYEDAAGRTRFVSAEAGADGAGAIVNTAFNKDGSIAFRRRFLASVPGAEPITEEGRFDERGRLLAGFVYRGRARTAESTLLSYVSADIADGGSRRTVIVPIDAGRSERIEQILSADGRLVEFERGRFDVDSGRPLEVEYQALDAGGRALRIERRVYGAEAAAAHEEMWERDGDAWRATFIDHRAGVRSVLLAGSLSPATPANGPAAYAVLDATAARTIALERDPRPQGMPASVGRERASARGLVPLEAQTEAEIARGARTRVSGRVARLDFELSPLLGASAGRRERLAQFVDELRPRLAQFAEDGYVNRRQGAYADIQENPRPFIDTLEWVLDRAEAIGGKPRVILDDLGQLHIEVAREDGFRRNWLAQYEHSLAALGDAESAAGRGVALYHLGEDRARGPLVKIFAGGERYFEPRYRGRSIDGLLGNASGSRWLEFFSGADIQEALDFVPVTTVRGARLAGEPVRGPWKTIHVRPSAASVAWEQVDRTGETVVAVGAAGFHGSLGALLKVQHYGASGFEEAALAAYRAAGGDVEALQKAVAEARVRRGALADAYLEQALANALRNPFSEDAAGYWLAKWKATLPQPLARRLPRFGLEQSLSSILGVRTARDDYIFHQPDWLMRKAVYDPHLSPTQRKALKYAALGMRLSLDTAKGWASLGPVGGLLGNSMKGFVFRVMMDGFGMSGAVEAGGAAQAAYQSYISYAGGDETERRRRELTFWQSLNELSAQATPFLSQGLRDFSIFGRMAGMTAPPPNNRRLRPIARPLEDALVHSAAEFWSSVEAAHFEPRFRRAVREGDFTGARRIVDAALAENGIVPSESREVGALALLTRQLARPDAPAVSARRDMLTAAELLAGRGRYREAFDAASAVLSVEGDSPGELRAEAARAALEFGARAGLPDAAREHALASAFPSPEVLQAAAPRDEPRMGILRRGFEGVKSRLGRRPAVIDGEVDLPRAVRELRDSEPGKNFNEALQERGYSQIEAAAIVGALRVRAEEASAAALPLGRQIRESLAIDSQGFAKDEIAALDSVLNAVEGQLERGSFNIRFESSLGEVRGLAHHRNGELVLSSRYAEAPPALLAAVILHEAVHGMDLTGDSRLARVLMKLDSQTLGRDTVGRRNFAVMNSEHTAFIVYHLGVRAAAPAALAAFDGMSETLAQTVIDMEMGRSAGTMVALANDVGTSPVGFLLEGRAYGPRYGGILNNEPKSRVRTRAAAIAEWIAIAEGHLRHQAPERVARRLRNLDARIKRAADPSARARLQALRGKITASGEQSGLVRRFHDALLAQRVDLRREFIELHGLPSKNTKDFLDVEVEPLRTLQRAARREIVEGVPQRAAAAGRGDWDAYHAHNARVEAAQRKLLHLEPELRRWEPLAQTWDHLNGEAAAAPQRGTSDGAQAATPGLDASRLQERLDPFLNRPENHSTKDLLREYLAVGDVATLRRRLAGTYRERRDGGRRGWRKWWSGWRYDHSAEGRAFREAAAVLEGQRNSEAVNRLNEGLLLLRDEVAALRKKAPDPSAPSVVAAVEERIGAWFDSMDKDKALTDKYRQLRTGDAYEVGGPELHPWIIARVEEFKRRRGADDGTQAAAPRAPPAPTLADVAWLGDTIIPKSALAEASPVRGPPDAPPLSARLRRLLEDPVRGKIDLYVFESGDGHYVVPDPARPVRFSGEELALIRSWGNHVEVRGEDGRPKPQEARTPEQLAGIVRMQPVRAARFARRSGAVPWPGRRVPEGLPRRYRAAVERTSELMNDAERCFEHMQALEREVIAESLETGKPLEAAREAVLGRWEKRHGFGELLILPRETLGRERFHRMLREKRMFMDPFFDNQTHGSLTHRLQWHLLMREMEINPTAFGRVRQASDLFDFLGYYKRAWLPIFDVERKLDWSATSYRNPISHDLWTVMFDDINFANNFTRPEWVAPQAPYWPGLGDWQR